jgi:hypothetical protein
MAFHGSMYATWQKSLITSILSAGTLLDALISGSVGEWLSCKDTGAFRIAIDIQFLWALILEIWLLFLPESAHLYVMKNNHDKELHNFIHDTIFGT